ncbi:MAG TPA: GNAT family N-acetyltransferase [Acidimicrobiales bacterium]
MPDISLTSVDKLELTRPHLRQLHALTEALSAEALPEDPPTPFELYERLMRIQPDHVDATVMLAHRGDRLVGRAVVSAASIGTNEHLVNLAFGVHPDERNQGVGRRLLESVVDHTDLLGRTTMLFFTSERVGAGERFAERIGAKRGLVSHTNRLALADVDRDLLDRWLADGPRSASDYTIEWVPSPTPDDLLDDVISAYHVMNDAPREELDMDDDVLTPDVVRGWESAMVESGSEKWCALARHDTTGEVAGYTEVLFHPTHPTCVYQMGTAVAPAHRGHRLGKWLKATMLARILDQRPERIDVRTENADSNGPMLDINNELGFTPYIAECVWQITVDGARSVLA